MTTPLGAAAVSSPAMPSRPFDIIDRALDASPLCQTREKALPLSVDTTACLRHKTSWNQAAALKPKRLIHELESATSEPTSTSLTNDDCHPKGVEAARPNATPVKSLAPKLSGKGGALHPPDMKHEVARRRDPGAPLPTLDLDDDDDDDHDDHEQGKAGSKRMPESVVVSQRLVDLCAAISMT
jgi:hypothetical protein